MSVNRVATIASTTVVVLALVAGLYLGGSPAEQRLHRMDQKRVRDLERISNALQFHRQIHEELPASLSELVDGQRLNELPVDPVTGANYEYTADSEGFALCAIFDRPSQSDRSRNFWRHDQGRQCFEFEATGNLAINRLPMAQPVPARPVPVR